MAAPMNHWGLTKGSSSSLHTPLLSMEEINLPPNMDINQVDECQLSSTERKALTKLKERWNDSRWAMSKMITQRLLSLEHAQSLLEVGFSPTPCSGARHPDGYERPMRKMAQCTEDLFKLHKLNLKKHEALMPKLTNKSQLVPRLSAQHLRDIETALQWTNIDSLHHPHNVGPSIMDLLRAEGYDLSDDFDLGKVYEWQ